MQAEANDVPIAVAVVVAVTSLDLGSALSSQLTLADNYTREERTAAELVEKPRKAPAAMAVAVAAVVVVPAVPHSVAVAAAGVATAAAVVVHVSLAGAPAVAVVRMRPPL